MEIIDEIKATHYAILTEIIHNAIPMETGNDT